MVMGSDDLKELYILTTFEDLRTRALERDFLMNFQTRTRCFEELEMLHIHIGIALNEKDQEKEFIYLCRFLQVIGKMDASYKRFKGKLLPDFKIYEIYERKHRDRLVQLEKVLKQRYEKLKLKKSLGSAKSSSINSNVSIMEPISRIIQPTKVSLGKTRQKTVNIINCGKHRTTTLRKKLLSKKNKLGRIMCSPQFFLYSDKYKPNSGYIKLIIQRVPSNTQGKFRAVLGLAIF